MINYIHLIKTFENDEDCLNNVDSVKQSKDYAVAIKWNACSRFDILFVRNKAGQESNNSSLVDIYIKESEANSFFSDYTLAMNFSMYANNEKLRFQFGRFYVVSDNVQSLLSNFKKEENESKNNSVISSDSGLDLLRYILRHALTINASDIHIFFKPDQSESEYFLRYHGERWPIEALVGKDVEVMLRDLPNRASSATKQEFNHASDLDYRAVFNVDNQEILIRYNQTPGQNQLSSVLRLAVKPTNKRNVKHPDLHDLGFPEDQIDAIERVCFKKEGGVLATGPTGSGKTTLARYIIRRRKESAVGVPHILTAEDPIESNIEGTHMTDLNSVTNSSEIIQRANRQDTDFFFLGEIRDRNHANIFEQVGMGGKPLLSTMHIGHPLEAYGKLIYSLNCNRNNVLNNTFLRCIIQMNLLQSICPHCSFTLDEAIKIEKSGSLRESVKENKPFNINPTVKEILYDNDNMFSRIGRNSLEFSPEAGPKSKYRIRNPKGCPKCRDNIKELATKSSALVSVGRRGIKGMIMVSETFVPNETLLQIYLTKDISKVTDYYNTLFRFESDFACCGSPIQEQAFRRLINGEICANYFNENVKDLRILLEEFCEIEIKTKEALAKIGVGLSRHGGFSYETHLKNSIAIKNWREEFYSQVHDYRELKIKKALKEKNNIVLGDEVDDV